MSDKKNVKIVPAAGRPMLTPAMVDCVTIDTAYNGKVFNVALSDIPERKTDFVNGHYDFPAPVGKTVVAIKVVDMLGEEVLVTAEA